MFKMCLYSNKNNCFLVMDTLEFQAGFQKIFEIVKVFGFESSPFVPLISLEIPDCTIYVFFKDKIDREDENKLSKFSTLQAKADRLMHHLPDEVKRIIELWSNKG